MPGHPAPVFSAGARAMNRQEKEELERRLLHPAACRAADSGGRAVDEDPDPWRTTFERDRDRIIHCSAFRRLEYKTQVFVNHVGDHHRTRLTHSLEVVQVARSLAAALNLNEPLVEAVALAHDLGHPPYGHAGEKLLDSRMQPHGGFSHNRQSARVVEVLEQRSPEYPGLNLTAEVRASLRKHDQAVDPASGARVRFPLLEAQVVDMADSTAYHYHDVEDGVRAEILDPLQMQRDLPLWAEAVARTRRRHAGLQEGDLLLWRRAANELLGLAIVDLQEEALRRLQRHQPRSPREAQELPERVLAHSEAFRSEVARLHEYLYQHMYFDERVNWHVRRATDLLDHLFTALLNKPEAVPERNHQLADSPARAVCDYVSGMTDRYVERVSRQLGILSWGQI
ncbi:MAG: dNTP triphosphohydrolase [Planctomycetota bacterium]|nr:MAG: dNTP triphosphohydrolase [Planctomycetota bacterium]